MLIIVKSSSDVDKKLVYPFCDVSKIEFEWKFKSLCIKYRTETQTSHKLPPLPL